MGRKNTSIALRSCAIHPRHIILGRSATLLVSFLRLRGLSSDSSTASRQAEANQGAYGGAGYTTETTSPSSTSRTENRSWCWCSGRRSQSRDERPLILG